jgi:hypothetical protein
MIKRRQPNNDSLIGNLVKIKHNNDKKGMDIVMTVFNALPNIKDKWDKEEAEREISSEEITSGIARDLATIVYFSAMPIDLIKEEDLFFNDFSRGLSSEELERFENIKKESYAMIVGGPIKKILPFLNWETVLNSLEQQQQENNGPVVFYKLLLNNRLYWVCDTCLIFDNLK